MAGEECLLKVVIHLCSENMTFKRKAERPSHGYKLDGGADRIVLFFITLLRESQKFCGSFPPLLHPAYETYPADVQTITSCSRVLLDIFCRKMYPL